MVGQRFNGDAKHDLQVLAPNARALREWGQQLHALLSDYWYDVDTNWGRNAGDFYTDDAVFETKTTSYRGKAKIREFYQWRVDRGPRIAIHCHTNFRVVFHDDRPSACAASSCPRGMACNPPRMTSAL